MIVIGRAIEGVSINGKEFLLDENGNIFKFESRKIAFEFLKSNGYGEFSDEEIQDNFFFDELEEVI